MSQTNNRIKSFYVKLITYPFSLLLQLITEVYFRKYQESEYLQYTVSGNWYIQLLYLVCIYSSILHTRSEHGSSVLEPY